MVCCCDLVGTDACKDCLAYKDNQDVTASKELLQLTGQTDKVFKWNYSPFESQTYTIPIQTAQKLVNCYECEYSYHWTFDKYNTNGKGICKLIYRDVKPLDGCTFGRRHIKV